jgi:hypothetical protein
MTKRLNMHRVPSDWRIGRGLPHRAWHARRKNVPEAADDADALTRAKEMRLLAASELWDHKRIVARIPARG